MWYSVSRASAESSHSTKKLFYLGSLDRLFFSGHINCKSFISQWVSINIHQFDYTPMDLTSFHKLLSSFLGGSIGSTEFQSFTEQKAVALRCTQMMMMMMVIPITCGRQESMRLVWEHTLLNQEHKLFCFLIDTYILLFFIANLISVKSFFESWDYSFSLTDFFLGHSFGILPLLIHFWLFNHMQQHWLLQCLWASLQFAWLCWGWLTRLHG